MAYLVNEEDARLQLRSAVEAFLEEVVIVSDEIESIEIVGYGVVAHVQMTYHDGVTGDTVDFWFSNENRIFQRGFFEKILDMFRYARPERGEE